MTHLLYCDQVVGEVWHEMCSGIRCNKQTHSAEVGTSVAGNKRIANSTNHPGQSNERLRELSIREEAVTLQNGRLHVADERESSRTHTEQLYCAVYIHNTLYLSIKLKEDATYVIGGGYNLGMSSLIEEIL